jgi:hypothetical protein
MKKKETLDPSDSTSHARPESKSLPVMYCRERVNAECEEQTKRLRRLFLFGISLCNVRISTSCSTFANAHRLCSTYVVRGFLIFVALLVLSRLGLIGGSLLVIQGLPALTKDFSDLT